MSFVEKPKWLEDYPEIKNCLQEFLNKLDKKPTEERASKKIPYAVNQKNFPSLWLQSSESDHQWQLIQNLEKDYGLCEIFLNKKRNQFDLEFINASIRMFCSAEDTIRYWLDRPYEKPLLKEWRQVVKQYESSFSGSTERLALRVFTIAEKSHEEVVLAFKTLKKYQNKKLTLRQLSAKCFWGMSKILDNQEDLVRSLFPKICIKSRPLIINLHIPDKAGKCLFIENYDTYVNALQGGIQIANNHILVYSSGFLGSANRIRTEQSVVFHYSSDTASKMKQPFENWWLCQADSYYSVFFWGDLDYSGIEILRSLKKVFPEITAWKPGYNKMLEALNEGIAHNAGISGKQNQLEPKLTGCTFTDDVLLPTIRDKILFVDQEII